MAEGDLRRKIDVYLDWKPAVCAIPTAICAGNRKNASK